MIFTAADEEESALPTSPQLASLGNAQDNSYAESSHLFSSTSLSLEIYRHLILSFIIVAALKQQKLKAWKPLLRPTTFIPFLFLVGVISIPLGAVFLGAFSNVTL